MQAYLTILSYISIHGVSAIPLIATVWSFNRLRPCHLRFLTL